MDKNYAFIKKAVIKDNTLKNLNKKYGSLSKNFVVGDCSNSKKIEKANIVNLSNKQLHDKLEKIEIKTEAKSKE